MKTSICEVLLETVCSRPGETAHHLRGGCARCTADLARAGSLETERLRHLSVSEIHCLLRGDEVAGLAFRAVAHLASCESCRSEIAFQRRILRKFSKRNKALLDGSRQTPDCLDGFQIRELVGGTLADAERGALLRHIDECDPCRARFGLIARAVAQLEQQGTAEAC
ncbi:MAG: hypothetical protein HY720_30915 [Planctomycetes bacterium]|nr:hypothetical protein [Planctomycetota bacterium]